MSVDEARAILAAFDGDANGDADGDPTLGPLVTLALATGLRQGELLALRWQDVDLDAGTVTVGATLQRVNGEYQRLAPKTERSRRSVPVPAFGVEALRRQRQRQVAQRLLTGEAWKNTFDLVFTRADGRPLDKSVVLAGFQATLAKAGLPKRRFHDLRHGFASLMLAQGVDLRTIMELLGHSNLHTTATVYTHVVPELARDAVRRLEVALR